MGNLPTGHLAAVRTGLPAATWRQQTMVCSQANPPLRKLPTPVGCEAYAEIDKALADLNGNTVQFRLSEDRAF